jgi:GNAT superfamily N-acetyltransferase
MSPPIIRAAVHEDFDAVRQLLEGLDELHRLRLPWLFRLPLEDARPTAFFSNLVASSNSTLLVTCDERVVVGALTTKLRDAPSFPAFIPQRWAVIDDLIVATTHRRRGIGAQLVRAAEAWAHSRAAAWVELNVYEFNADARSFYEAAGYFSISTKLRKAVAPPF